MTIRDMHIEINQALQKVAANRTRKYLDEEIDLVLNKIITRFIQSKIVPVANGKGGFQVDQLQLDAIRSHVKQKSYKASLTTSGYYRVRLPDDYAYYVASTTTLQRLCKGLIEPQPLEISQKITVVKQPQSSKTAPPYYQSVVLKYGSESVAIPGNLPYDNEYKGYLEKSDVSFIVPFILKSFRDKGVEVYWERFLDYYVPDSYLFVGEIPVTVVIDGTPIVDQRVLIVKKELFSLADGQAVSRPNRLYASNEIGFIQESAYYKSNERSPVVEIVGNILRLYKDNSFIVSMVAVTYVRNPQVVSLVLGTDCDVAPEFHPAICDLAVEYILGKVGDTQSQQIAESDIARRVTL